jgi:ABC-type polysaccharide/polyol phosphate transport system ATPase subunit
MSIAIRVEHLSKEYRLGIINHGMLYKDIQSWMARRLGRPDPHGQIGMDHFADQADRFWALKDLNFDIKEGDRVGIIGKNGAGKSTLLKVLSRITAPTEGVAKIKGRVTSLLEVGTGFHGELTGRENIYLNGAILGMKQREITRKIDEIIDFAEIAKFIDTPVKRYSSGMYVRLAFSVAAHLDSEILIADEVLAVGDAAFQKKALGKMNALSNGQGRTVLFVSHNMGSVKQLCNMGMVLESGKNRPIQSIETAIQRYMESSEIGVQTDIKSYQRNKGCSLRARIIGFSVITPEGENTGKVYSDQPLKVKFVVESYFDGVRAGMQLMIAHNGQNLVMFDSGHLQNLLFTLDKGTYELECDIGRLSLYAGAYSLSIGLDIPATEQLDQIPEVYFFEIPFYDPASTGYNLHVDNNWGVYNPEHSYSCSKLD